MTEQDPVRQLQAPTRRVAIPEMRQLGMTDFHNEPVLVESRVYLAHAFALPRVWDRGSWYGCRAASRKRIGQIAITTSSEPDDREPSTSLGGPAEGKPGGRHTVRRAGATRPGDGRDGHDPAGLATT